MTRITIDISESGAALTQQSGQQPVSQPGPNVSGAPAELLDRAAALAATNGGPAPPFQDVPSASQTLSLAPSGTPGQPGPGSISAGAAPESAFRSFTS